MDNFWQISVRLCRGGQVWMSQTDRAGMRDMANWWMWVCLQV